jgi:hypothetical protein
MLDLRLDGRPETLADHVELSLQTGQEEDLVHLPLGIVRGGRGVCSECQRRQEGGERDRNSRVEHGGLLWARRGAQGSRGYLV